MAVPTFNIFHDILSGIILAATSLPQLIAYAETIGYTSSYHGLVSAGPSLLFWGVCTGSPWTNAGVTSLTAIMTRADLGLLGTNEAAYDIKYDTPGVYKDSIALYSLFVGVTSLLLALVGFTTLAVKHVPYSVKVGFKWGCEMGVLTSAVPGGLYYYTTTTLSSSSIKEQITNSYFGLLATSVQYYIPDATGISGVINMTYAILHPKTWDIDAFIIFINCIIFIMYAKDYFLPRWTPPGSEVILATIAATIFSIYTNYEGAIVGDIPSSTSSSLLEGGGFAKLLDSSFWTTCQENGLLSTMTEVLPIQEFITHVKRLISVPLIERSFDGSIITLFVTATVFSAVNYLSIVAISSGFEKDDNVPWNPNRELVAQGVSNIVSGLVGGAPVSGSMSRSLISRMSGATSRVACIVTSLIWIYMMPYMSVMSYTPKAALSAVIVSAVLMNVINPTKLLSLCGIEFIVGLGTAFVSAIVNPTMGFVLGCVLHYSIHMGMDTKKKMKAKAD
jgi:MFS superfamily sulfate permease-like transporter